MKIEKRLYESFLHGFLIKPEFWHTDHIQNIEKLRYFSLLK